MKVTTKEMQERRLAVLEQRGDPKTMGDNINKLISWARAQSVNLKPKPGEAFGFGYDDPKTTPPEVFRFDLGLTIPENLTLSSKVVEKRIPAGRYAVAMHKDTHSNIDQTIYGIYRDCISQSGEELGDFPCIVCYHNFEHEVAETELLTEIWVLLK